MIFSVSQPSRHQVYRSNWSSYAPGQTGLVANIHKLFSERIEIFSSVEFSKVSILTGIIKISLKVISTKKCQILIQFLKITLYAVDPAGMCSPKNIQ